jgi:hypothetical protein
METRLSRVRICLFGSRSNYHQPDSCYKRDRAQNRRDRKRVLSLMRDLNRAEVDIFLLMRERDSAGSKADDAEDDEEYSDDGGRLHGVVAFPVLEVSATCVVMPIVRVPDVPATVFLQALVDNSNQE